jgi:60 kDa SS-A/Ro ribonucleoprotein
VRGIKVDGVPAVKRIVEISDSGRAPKNDPAVFALALVAAHGSPEAKALAFQNLAKVCRIGTHLFHFAEYVNALRGWGRGLRNAVALHHAVLCRAPYLAWSGAGSQTQCGHS